MPPNNAAVGKWGCEQSALHPSNTITTTRAAYHAPRACHLPPSIHNLPLLSSAPVRDQPTPSTDRWTPTPFDIALAVHDVNDRQLVSYSVQVKHPRKWSAYHSSIHSQSAAHSQLRHDRLGYQQNLKSLLCPVKFCYSLPLYPSVHLQLVSCLISICRVRARLESTVVIKMTTLGKRAMYLCGRPKFGLFWGVSIYSIS